MNIENNTENVNPRIQFILDENGESVETSYPQVPVRVQQGQSISINGIVEAGALYRSMATQLEGYTFASYSSWKGSVVPVLFGYDKPETKDVLNPYIDSVKDYIVLVSPLKSVMNKLLHFLVLKELLIRIQEYMILKLQI